MRFLLDPVSGLGGGGGQVDMAAIQALLGQLQVSAAPLAAAEKPPEIAKPEENPLLKEIRDHLAKLQGQAVENDRRHKEEIARKEKDGLISGLSEIASKGNLVDLKSHLEKLDGFVNAKLGEKDLQTQQIRDLYHGSMKTGEVARAMTGISFVSGAAAKQAQDLVLQRLEVIDDGTGKISVREKQTGRSVEEVLKAALNSEDFLHFLAPSQRGKGGIGGGNSAQPSFGGATKPLSLEARIAQKIESQEAQWSAYGLHNTGGLVLAECPDAVPPVPASDERMPSFF